jgi:parvulin-like peptidyl-prolyl isomerase
MAADSEGVNHLLNRSKTMLGEEKFQELMKKRNSTEEEYREFLEIRSLIKQYKDKLFAGISITDDELKRYHEGHEKSFITPEKVSLEVLVVRNPEVADEIYKKVKAGEDFDKVAQEYSNAGKEVYLRRTGLTRSDTVPRTIQLKAKAGDIGDIIGTVQVEKEIRMFKLLDRQPSGVLTYEEAIQWSRDLFMKKRQQEILGSWAESAKQKARIEYIR